jgi:hypothetical protein
MTGNLQPLDSKFAIVDKNGNPTDYFTRWAQQKQIDIGKSISLTDLTNYLAGHKLIAGTGIQLTPDGNIADGVTIHADAQAILDEITATRGALLYRGLLGWTALTPGTSGQFLKTNGAGADPAWAAAGGGGTAWDFLPPTAASFSLVSGDATQLALTDDSNVGLITQFNSAATGGQVMRCAFRTLSNKALDWTLTIKMKMLIPSINYRGIGILLYDSLSANNIGFEVTTDSGLRVAKWTNLLGTGGVNLATQNVTAGTYIEWLQVVHTGGNYIFNISENGKLWVEHSRVVDTAQMANRADKVGISLYNLNSGSVCQATVPYFSLTGPGV